MELCYLQKYMKTWNDIKLNDYIYVLVYHKNSYIEIRRCKVIDVKDLSFLKSENHEFLLIKDMSVSENDWQIKK